MTKYEMLMSLSDLAVIKARGFARIGESDMARYWNNVAHEYRDRALALRCADAKKEEVNDEIIA